jgi:hypothetical protein
LAVWLHVESGNDGAGELAGRWWVLFPSVFSLDRGRCLGSFRRAGPLLSCWRRPKQPNGPTAKLQGGSSALIKLIL